MGGMEIKIAPLSWKALVPRISIDFKSEGYFLLNAKDNQIRSLRWCRILAVLKSDICQKI